jgi:diaminopropionate ammonia-lyase
MHPLTVLLNLKSRMRVFHNASCAEGSACPLIIEDHVLAMHEVSSWPGYRATPLWSLTAIAKAAGIGCLWYKDEGARFTLKSFKALGGSYAIVRLLQSVVAQKTGCVPTSDELRKGSHAGITREITVTTATDGNHGRAVAWAAQMFGCQCVIYVPKACTPWREHAIAAYGANVVRTNLGYDETSLLCAREAKESNRLVVCDSSWPGYTEIPTQIMNGYTVMAEEILQQLPPDQPLTHVFVQGGVGALAGAISAHFTNRVGTMSPAVIVVEPEGAACLYASARAGKAVAAPEPVHTIMAGLECGEVSTVAWEILRHQTIAFATVPDAVVAPTMCLLATPIDSDPKIVAGESAVAGLAALLMSSDDKALRESLRLDSSSRVLVIGSEGNTDPGIYDGIVGREPV